jgi:hypothetical protein
MKIVCTGGPGGGKSTACDLMRREFGSKVFLVPEAATLLFGGGFPRVMDNADARRATQRALFHLQLALEQIYATLFPTRILLCDRGTLDGFAYWPDGDDFWTAMGTTREAELARYDGVLFFESAAQSSLSINASMMEGGNVCRIEDQSSARTLDDRLRALYELHPNFHVVPSTKSFLQKVQRGVDAGESANRVRVPSDLLSLTIAQPGR